MTDYFSETELGGCISGDESRAQRKEMCGTILAYWGIDCSNSGWAVMFDAD
jgi:hypothetical protein